jgi:hypothetical protein
VADWIEVGTPTWGGERPAGEGDGRDESGNDGLHGLSPFAGPGSSLVWAHRVGIPAFEEARLGEGIIERWEQERCGNSHT